MTTVADVYSRVQTDIGDAGGIFIKLPHIIEWCNRALRDIYRTSEFGRNEVQSFTINEGQEVWAPVGQIKAVHFFYVGMVLLEETTPQQLINQRTFMLEHRISTFDLNEKGTPHFYWRENKIDRVGSADMVVNVRFWPIPDKDYECSASVAQNPPVLSESAGADNLSSWLTEDFIDDLVLYCVAKGHERSKDYEAAGVAMGQYIARMDRRFDDAHELDDDFRTISPDTWDHYVSYVE